jgi:hypothetical protein
MLRISLGDFGGGRLPLGSEDMLMVDPAGRVAASERNCFSAFVVFVDFRGGAAAAGDGPVSVLPLVPIVGGFDGADKPPNMTSSTTTVFLTRLGGTGYLDKSSSDILKSQVSVSTLSYLLRREGDAGVSPPGAGCDVGSAAVFAAAGSAF